MFSCGGDLIGKWDFSSFDAMTDGLKRWMMDFSGTHGPSVWPILGSSLMPHLYLIPKIEVVLSVVCSGPWKHGCSTDPSCMFNPESQSGLTKKMALGTLLKTLWVFILSLKKYNS